MSYYSLYDLPYLRNGFNCSSYPFCSLYHQRFFPVYQYIRYDRNRYTNNKQFNEGKFTPRMQTVTLSPNVSE